MVLSMPRIARVVAPGLPHHVTQRGNRRMNVFLDDKDRREYLGFLEQYRDKHSLEILAYCLMSNHIHLVAVPKEDHSLARTLADTHMRYAQHFNWKYSESGHLWQGRFFSCVLDERHTLASARYVERNPVRAGLVGRAWEYRWSSARGHVGESRDSLLSDRWPGKRLIAQWRELLVEFEDVRQVEGIRASTRTGRPLGTPRFIDRLERTMGRMMRPKKAGRPPKPHRNE
jgi:putative transposase